MTITLPDPDEASHPTYIPRTLLRPGVLLALRSSGPLHGYALLERLDELGIAEVDQSGLYRVLRAMEHDGLLASHWESSPHGPDRRVYAVTPTGIDLLDDWAVTLDQAHRFLHRYLRHYQVVCRAEC